VLAKDYTLVCTVAMYDFELPLYPEVQKKQCPCAVVFLNLLDWMTNHLKVQEILSTWIETLSSNVRANRFELVGRMD
jgi:hypothetical protein